MDKPKAITANAHKLARLVYFMLTKGQTFVEAGQDEYEEREIEWYHRIRNQLYHSGNGIKVEVASAPSRK